YGPGSYGTMFTASSDWRFGGTTPGGPARKQPGEVFPPWIIYMHSGQRFLKIDLNDRTVAPAGTFDDIRSVGEISGPELTDLELVRDGRARTWKEYALRRTDRVTLFNPANGATFDYMIPPALRNVEFSLFPVPGKREALAVVESYARRAPHFD